MIAQDVPYKMQNPKVKPSRNHNFGTTWKHYKIPNQVSFFDDKMVLVQIARPKMYFGYHSQVQNGPNRPTYFLEEIQVGQEWPRNINNHVVNQCEYCKSFLHQDIMRLELAMKTC